MARRATSVIVQHTTARPGCRDRPGSQQQAMPTPQMNIVTRENARRAVIRTAPPVSQEQVCDSLG